MAFLSDFSKGYEQIGSLAEFFSGKKVCSFNGSVYTHFFKSKVTETHKTFQSFNVIGMSPCTHGADQQPQNLNTC